MMIITENIKKNFYPVTGTGLKKKLTALNDISITFQEGQITGVVGESGSGKSTLARVLMGLIKPDSGFFKYGDKISSSMKKSDWIDYRKKVQMIFQDPYGSLNPRLNIEKIIMEPLVIHKKSLGLNKTQMMDEVVRVLQTVGLDASILKKYPNEFSGGQRQRLGIARALILKPELLILDEPVSALDVSIQAQVMNMLGDLRKQYSLTYIFIAHDLAVVNYISDRIIVMYAGRIVESGSRVRIFTNPIHPYTKLLLKSSPSLELSHDDHILLESKTAEKSYAEVNMPTASERIPACDFYYRCPNAKNICSEIFPGQTATNDDGFFHCHNPV